MSATQTTTSSRSSPSPTSGESSRSILRRPNANFHGPLLQRKCASCGESSGGNCGECKKKRLQRKASEGGVGFSSKVESLPSLENLTSGGRPLEASLRSKLEPGFGFDFSRVRIHDDVASQAATRSVSALAFTVGDHVHFGKGQYQPQNQAGYHLLAHELSHTIQQRGVDPVSQSASENPIWDSPQSSLEHEADRAADVILGGGNAKVSLGAARGGGAFKLQRQEAPGASVRGPQTVGGDPRIVALPDFQRGSQRVTPYVFRHLEACPCRRVPEIREGVFWNPNPGNFAIAYRHCRGSARVDAYARLESNIASVLTAGASPEGTATLGFDLNLFGRNSGGRVILEGRGTNIGGTGAGGRARLVYEGGQQWTVFIEADYLRRLATGIANPDTFTGSFGVEVGGMNFSVSATGQNGGWTGTFNIGGSFGTRVEHEDCYTCFCPPPVPQYTCHEFEHDWDEEVTTEMDTFPVENYRVYYGLDTTNDSEDFNLISASSTALTNLTNDVQQRGATIESVIGYASPEASEAHNADLSRRRGENLRTRVRSRVGTGVTVPEAQAGGELLGRTETAGGQLSDSVTPGAGNNAEDVSMLNSVMLTSAHIENGDLNSQFMGVFQRLTEPPDRLALFGISASHPLAPRLLAAINRFVANGGRGPRPWEGIFRYLRTAVVRARRLERISRTETVTHRGGMPEVTGTTCRDRVAIAEAMTPGFGPIDPSALRPSPTQTQRDTDCLDEPTSADTARGCRYSAQRGPAPTSGPSVAPNPLGSLRMRP